jgi:transcriptional regulator with XRE-family HTH domain
MLNLILIGNRISTRRKERKMTQNELADKLFVTHQAVSKWENGKSLPTIDILYELTKLLDITIDYLLDDTDIDEYDYETQFKNYDRQTVLNNFLKQENWYLEINSIFYLLNNQERFKIIHKITSSQTCFVIRTIWPYLNQEERIYLLGIILSDKCEFDLQQIYHHLTEEERLIVQKSGHITYTFTTK